jgi:hypothetical protein
MMASAPISRTAPVSAAGEKTPLVVTRTLEPM